MITTQSKPAKNKSAAIKEFILSQIRIGQLAPGDPVPSVNKLATMFAVNRNTTAKVLSELTIAGDLSTERGKGTFVAFPDDDTKAEEGTEKISLFMPLAGHVYDDQRRILLQGIQAHGCYGMTVEIGHYTLEEYEKKKKCVTDALASSPKAMIIDGGIEFPYEIFLQHTEELPRLIFINNYEFEFALPGVCVLTDYFEGGRIVAEHLLKAGRKKVSLLVQSPPRLPEGRSFSSSMGYFRFIEGYRSAVGGEGDVIELVRGSEKDRILQIEKLLRAEDRPDGIVLSADYYAKLVFEAAFDVGLNVPRDLALVGRYNTPWAEAMSVPLTSLSIKPEEIARRAVLECFNRLDMADVGSEKIIIKPELVIRKSCGTKN